MRQRLGKKKVERLRRETGLPIAIASVRGGDDHGKLLILEDGSVYWMYKDGRLEKEKPWPRQTGESSLRR